jgi:uncharacterized protein YbjT (DUF2867 family)
MTNLERVLVTGATGYIGGRLVPRLLEAGHRVRCIVRDPRKLDNRAWISHPELDVVRCDVLDTDRLAAAMEGCGAAYYLIHSMVAAGARYHEHDMRLARSFARAGELAGPERIIYLGGLGETGAGLSQHLLSRREVESALTGGGVPVTVLRAAMVIGSGSASFEILRYLVERLPVMITPRWVGTECQPIAIRNALDYLIACLDHPETAGRTLDIGGPDVLRYSEILQLVARSLGLRRRVILPVPILTPKLSSLWIHLVTPVSQHIARPLAEGLRNRVVCRNDDAARLMPQELLTVEEAVDRAVGESGRETFESTWMDAGVIPGDPDWAGGAVYADDRGVDVEAAPADVFDALCRVGGRQGWYSASWLWKLRGFIDRLAGGPGIGRGRRHPHHVEFGDVLDFWRVTGLEPNRRLRLTAEMKLPGEATLEFEITSTPATARRTHLRQVATFSPRGLAGIAYWFFVKPIHGFVFHKMLHGIKADAEARGGS